MIRFRAGIHGVLASSLYVGGIGRAHRKGHYQHNNDITKSAALLYVGVVGHKATLGNQKGKNDSLHGRLKFCQF